MQRRARLLLPLAVVPTRTGIALELEVERLVITAIVTIPATLIATTKTTEVAVSHPIPESLLPAFAALRPGDGRAGIPVAPASVTISHPEGGDPPGRPALLPTRSK